MSRVIGELSANLSQSETGRGQWICALDLDWCDDGPRDGEQVGYIEVFGPSPLEAARAMVSFLHTMGATTSVWILDEDERAYLSYRMGKNNKPIIRLHAVDWNRGGGKTAWSEEAA